MRVARLVDYKKFEFSNSDIIEPNDGECLLKVKVVSPTRNKNFAVQVLINK